MGNQAASNNLIINVPLSAVIFLSVVVSILLVLVFFILWIYKLLCFKFCPEVHCLSLSNNDSRSLLSDSEDSDEGVTTNYDFVKESKPEDKQRLRSRSIVPQSDADISFRNHEEDDAYSGHRSDDASSKRTSKRGRISTSCSLDLQDDQQHRNGVLQVRLRLEPARSRLHVHIIQLLDLPGLSATSASDLITKPTAASVATLERQTMRAYQVHMTLMPDRKQRCKTKIRAGPDLHFEEDFSFNKVTSDNLDSLSIRFRLYGSEKVKLEKVIGQCLVSLNTTSLSEVDSEYNFNLTKEFGEFGSTSSDLDNLSLVSFGDAAMGQQELLLGMCYNGTTGRLAVEVVKAMGLKTSTPGKMPDSYVKLTLMSNAGKELAHSKTSVRKASTSPLYRETFMFQVPLFQLNEVTLMVSVYSKRTVKKEMLGWFSLGCNSTGEEEKNHWQEMRQSNGEQMTRWHVLLLST